MNNDGGTTGMPCRRYAVIAHPDKQHSYFTAMALKSHGVKVRYITTIYNKKGSVTAFLIKMLPSRIGQRLEKYRSDFLIDEEVIQLQEFFFLVVMMLGHVPFLKPLKESIRVRALRRFNRMVVAFVNKTSPDVLITYDTLSGDALKMIKEGGARTLVTVDMSAPYYPEMCLSYKKFETNFADSNTRLTLNAIYGKLHFDRLRQAEEELQYADRFLTASNYTKATLMANGVSEERIFICRYGINQNIDVPSGNSQERVSSKLTAVYIGNVSFQKGIRYLLNAMDGCREIIEDCILIGSCAQAPELVEEYRNRYTFMGHIPHIEVYRVCNKADFGVFPSLSDGFGFAVAECLSCGLPVICSSNAGASDIIINGYNGFVVPAGDAESIMERIWWFHSHPEEFAVMKRNAKQSVVEFTWDCYSDAVFASIALCEKEGISGS